MGTQAPNWPSTQVSAVTVVPLEYDAAPPQVKNRNALCDVLLVVGDK